MFANENCQIIDGNNRNEVLRILMVGRLDGIFKANVQRPTNNFRMIASLSIGVQNMRTVLKRGPKN